MRAWAMLAAAAALFGTVSCESTPSTPDEVPYVAPPCSGVYNQAVNSCLQQSGCSGLGCLYYWSWCGSTAGDQALSACCAGSYSSVSDQQECLRLLGSGP